VKYVLSYFLLLLLLSILSLAKAADHWESIVDAADIWKYTIPTSELPINWTNSEFDDTSWLSGSGGFGYGDDDDNTIIPEGTASVFIRKNFIVTDASALVAAILYVDYDDAFVAYLNGIEIARANIGTTGIRPAFNETSVNALEPASANGEIPPRFVIDNAKLASALLDGNNTLALQFHNYAASSSDLSSTTYFFGGFSSASDNFRSPPTWFNAPPEVISHLPIIVIDTWGGFIQSEPKTDAWMKIIDNGQGQINNINDPATGFDGYIGIEIRGQSSQMFPKKSYGFETRNELKEDSSVSLLGMPKESDWILSAPYSDKTMMRNPMTYHLGNQMGRWQPRTRWCEVYINGDYQGVYFLLEKIKRDNDRVNIDKLLPTEIADDSITGGYIVKVDKIDDLSTDEYFQTNPINWSNARHYNFTYVYPKLENIVPEQKEYIKNFLTEMENALNGTNFKDPVKGFRAYLDESSFVDFQIIQELVNNVDGYRYSTFFHKEKDSDGGKLIAGPLWDFDLCYGNVDYAPLNLSTVQWLYTSYGPYEYMPMHWWARMMGDPDYANLLKWRYSNLRQGPLDTDSIFYYLDLNQNLLGSAIDRNFERWPILNQYVWPNNYVGGTYENEMDYLKTWISNRLTWMDSKWLIPLNSEEYLPQTAQIIAYPNPFNNFFRLSLKLDNSNEITINIFNLQGQKVHSNTYLPFDNSTKEILVKDIILKPGIYILQVHQSGQLIAVSKIIRSYD
jgi:hypothetical protein